MKRERLKIVHLVNTHGHIDHTFGNAEAREATGADVLIHKEDVQVLDYAPAELLFSLGLSDYTAAEPDSFLDDGEEIVFGEHALKVIHTPGHTPGGVCLLGDGMLFSGDTLFADSVGRTDIPGGNWENLIRGIREKIFVLPDETDIYPGHGPATTVGHEKKFNPFAGEAADKS